MPRITRSSRLTTKIFPISVSEGAKVDLLMGGYMPDPRQMTGDRVEPGLS